MAKDIIHDAVKNALIKDGWTITHDPYTIRYRTLELSADLGAERTLAAERSGQKIVIEIKSFRSPSLIQDFKLALGQYILYEGLIEVTEPERKLYLAISQRVYQEFLNQDAIGLILQRNHVSIVVVNVNKEEVITWVE